MHSIIIPDYCNTEIAYIAEIIFKDVLGIDFRLITKNTNHITIEKSKKKLILPATFFALAKKHWLKKLSMPMRPLKHWDTGEIDSAINLLNSKIPIIYGEPGCQFHTDKIQLNMDILGSSFFMLTRYEEMIVTTRDKYDRFPAGASLAYQEGFLDRPIINEYIEILWSCMHHLWPELERKKRQFRQLVSCDVDKPFKCTAKSLYLQFLEVLGDIGKRKCFKLAVRNCKNYWSLKKGDITHDPNNTFNLIMDECESAKLKCAFYFISSHTDELSSMDGCYTLYEPAIPQLIKKIAQRGHEIGVHPSFETYCSAEKTIKEFKALKTLCEQLEINQKKWGGRQHYLRWNNPETFLNWDQAELDYDSTLAFPEYTGFRCGICYEYHVYDLKSRKRLNLLERPLVVMDVTVLSKLYMNKNYSDAKHHIINLKNTCRQFNGDFTLLWHNSNLIGKENRIMFKDVLLA